METFDIEMNSDKCKPFQINSEKSAILGGEILDLINPAVYFFELTYGVTIKKPGEVTNNK